MMMPPVRSATELLPLLPELVLVAGAFALLMLDLFLSERRRVITHLAAIGLLLVAVVLIGTGTGGHGSVLSDMFVRDTAADVIKFFIGIVAALTMVYAWPYLRARGMYQGEVSVLMLFATLGMMLMVSAGSLVMVYVGLEMLALCSYALVALDRDSPVASEAGIDFVSSDQIEQAAVDAGLEDTITAAVVDDYESAQLQSLKAGLLAAATLALISLAFTRALPSTVTTAEPAAADLAGIP